MLRVTNDLLVSAGTGSSTFAVTLDLTAAFDTVNHGKLLKRLSREFGVTDMALKWLSSYLDGRKQYVKVGTAVANTTTCASGVPQGSVLGPLLFASYIAPAARLIRAHNIRHHAYADDITLYAEIGADPQTSRTKVLDCASDVGRWFMENDLLLNAAKSEVIEFGTKHQLKKSTSSTSYSTSGANIIPSDHVKILGVTLDANLTFDRQISSTCSACAMHTKALRHIPRCTNCQHHCLQPDRITSGLLQCITRWNDCP
jgi:hypothetical protein